MNNLEIECSLLHNSITKQHFGGIYNVDTLPLTIHKKPCLIVMNTDLSSGPGEHWIAIYVTKQGICEFFDSAGNNPIFYGIEHFLISYGPRFTFNTKRLQDYNSETCGHFVLYYAFKRCQGLSLENIVRDFNDLPLKRNDELVKRFVFDYFYLM